jgi:ComF family protein
MNIFEDLLNLFFPNTCCTCDTTLVNNEELLCFRCRSQLPKTYYECPDSNELVDRFFGKLHILYGFAFLSFHKSGLTQKLLHQFKYHNKPEIGVMIGRWLGEDLQRYHNLKKVDLIVPIPLHQKKQRLRGYNQSYHFAKGISEILEIPVDTTLLKRIRHDKSQTGKTREMRWKGVENAFELTDNKSIKDKHILLVDDVVTTGATIEACGKHLYNSGVSQISVAAMAIAK